MAIKTITSEPMREVQSWLGLVPYYKLRADQSSPIIVDISGRMGMGALIAKALQFYALADNDQSKISVVSSCPLYCENGNEDVFSTFFVKTNHYGSAKLLSANAYRWALRHAVPKSLTIQEASSLFDHNFKPKSELKSIVSDIILAEGPFDLSIHYRGTDKVLESGIVSYARIIERLDAYISRHSINQIFLATDDPAFEDVVRNRFRDVKFSSFNLGSVAAGVPRHFSNLIPRDKALEALVNAYLIASAPACIRTSSYLSSLSKIINPKLITYTINRTQAKRIMFPEDSVLVSEEAWSTGHDRLRK